MTKEWWRKTNDIERKKQCLLKPKKKSLYDIQESNNKLGEYIE